MVRDVSPDSQEKVVSQLINGICEDKDVKQSLTSTELVTIWCWYQQIIRRKLSISHYFHGQLDQQRGGAQQIAGPPVCLLIC